MNLLRTISIMASFLAILAGWNFGVMLEVGLGMLGFIGMTQISKELRGSKFFYSPYLAILLASVFLVFAGIGEMRLGPDLVELADLRIDVEEKDKLLDDLRVQIFKDGVYVSRRTPSRLHDRVLTEDGIQRIRILGVNSLAVLHKFRQYLKELLARPRPIRLEVLLLDPRSPAFETRRDQEECGAKTPKECVTTIPNRMYEEWEATFAILSDIASYSRQHIGDDEVTQARIAIKIHAQKPEDSALFVETLNDKFLITNRYSEERGEGGQEGGSALITAKTQPGMYDTMDRIFKRLWDDATSISLHDLETVKVSRDSAHIVVLSEFPLLEAEDTKAKQIYERALTLHKQRRLSEASELYRRVLEVEPARSATAQELELVRRFLPHVFVTPNEPFELKDFVVVLHPRKPLIAYHLVWQDDIDYLTDNDPGDHEIVWIRYRESDRRTVEQAWAYWHGKFPCSETSVDRANRADARINVFVQWGKHGSLLDGWENVIYVDGVISAEELEPLQYSRLQGEGRYRADTFYANKWDTNFDGSSEEFVDFTRQVDVSGKLEQSEMIMVTQYANAVIDQELLPYNIYPKPDWPPEDGDNRFCGTSK